MIIHFLDTLELSLTYIVEFCTALMELFGVVVLVYTAVRCFIRWLKHDSQLRLDLAQGIALALEFKMGGEVLRTVVVRDWAELGILGAIILLRGLLTFLIHWEIKNEEEALEKRNSASQ
ncbi:MAG: DUF1622 domain-containing protein [Clostridiales bacterium]|nr:DUF1622 domain-containing protein [Clostridiales bacterium]